MVVHEKKTVARTPPLGNSSNVKHHSNVHVRMSLKPLSLQQLESASEILPYLWIAKADDAILADTAQLLERGIGYLINCAKEKGLVIPRRRKKLASQGLEVVTLNLEDAPEENLTDAIKTFFAVIKRAKSEGKKCLIYCHSGMSRSVSLALAYLLACEHMSLIEAFSHVKKIRMFASPNPGFMAQLMSLERSLDRMRGGDGKCSTVDLDRYRSNRFGDTNTFEATQQQQRGDSEVSLPSCSYNDNNNNTSHRRNLSASALLPFLGVAPNNNNSFSLVSEVDDDDSFFSGLCSACALDVFDQQLKNEEGKGREK